ncbi:IPTL-CTERM sorting domain-containing protein [Delftia sp. Lp-1]|uniref:IPTL-CTERM sorting domain-containing protein n=1 Tax=Delftia sp. Lp-1 TaxID=682863 RepID=UPI001E613D82|nr:IPTL-CTERM sorting domain-containing protein [Delftia sp. Lp-1]MCB4789126.1 IPTL-CTERM sorting domain-containing protein [Delftia sp. Lp-1]
MRFHPPSVPRRRRSKPALAACLLWASTGLAHAVPGPSQSPAHHRAHTPAHSPAHAPAHGSAQARQIPHAQQALQGLSVPFEANSGQFDPAVAFTGRTFAGAIHVTRQGQIVYSLAAPAQQQGVTSAPPPEMPPQAPPQAPPKKPPKAPAGTQPQAPSQTPPATQPLSGWSLTETLAGALPLSPTGGEAAATQITRFSGPHSYQPATYRNLHLGQAWPGVQVELAVRGANVEKLFHVAPQADPGQIQVRVDGALSLRLGEGGELVAATGHGDVAYTAPVAFQEVAGRRVHVPVQYALNSRGDGYGFALGAYDQALPLVIDPFLQSTHLGGSGNDAITALALAPAGQVLVAGITRSSDFPGTAGGALAPSATNVHLFVARLSGDLRTLEQSSYLGMNDGGDFHFPSMAILPSGDVVVAGDTSSGNLPGAVNGAQPANPGARSGFVTRLSADLRTLVQSTYLGGSGGDSLTALAITPSGDIVVGGSTESSDFPGTAQGAIADVAPNTRNGFAALLSADLRTLVRSTYITGADSPTALALTPSGDVLVAGSTTSPNLPATTGSAQPKPGSDNVLLGREDGFITRLSADLRTLKQSTYLGGAANDAITALAITPSGEVVVGGSTGSNDLPGTAGGAQPDYYFIRGNPSDGFVTLLSGDLRTLGQSTYLGAADSDDITALAITPSGEVVVGGHTRFSGFPGTEGGAQPVRVSFGFQSGFVTRLSADLRTLEQSTFLSGESDDHITALATTPSGEVVVGGYTQSRNLPGMAGGAQETNAGTADGFITRLSADLRAVSPQAITFPPQADQVLTATGDTFQISPIATANSGLAVNYTAHTPAVCTVSGTTVTMVDAGPCMLEAWLPSVPGQWLAANGIFVTLQIRRPQVISFPAQADQPFTAGASFDLGPPATASSNLPVDYASTTPGVCTVSGATVTMVSAGTCRLTASQPGNTLWLAATDVSQDIELVASTVSPPSPLPPPPPPAPGPGPGAASPVPVPTLGPWALVWLGTLAAGLGAISLRRRARHSSAR